MEIPLATIPPQALGEKKGQGGCGSLVHESEFEVHGCVRVEFLAVARHRFGGHLRVGDAPGIRHFGGEWGTGSDGYQATRLVEF